MRGEAKKNVRECRPCRPCCPNVGAGSWGARRGFETEAAHRDPHRRLLADASTDLHRLWEDKMRTGCTMLSHKGSTRFFRREARAGTGERGGGLA